jgi:hypothetical protein
MSHDRSWHDACVIRFSNQMFHFYSHSKARGVTAVGVGSGALFGVFFSGTGNQIHTQNRLLPRMLEWDRIRNPSPSAPAADAFELVPIGARDKGIISSTTEAGLGRHRARAHALRSSTLSGWETDIIRGTFFSSSNTQTLQIGHFLIQYSCGSH